MKHKKPKKIFNFIKKNLKIIILLLVLSAIIFFFYKYSVEQTAFDIAINTPGISSSGGGGFS